MKNEKKLPITAKIRTAYYIVSYLEKIIPTIIFQYFWESKIDIEEKKEFIKLFQEERAKLYSIIRTKYPKTKGKTISTDGEFVYYWDIDENNIENNMIKITKEEANMVISVLHFAPKSIFNNQDICIKKLKSFRKHLINKLK